MARTYRNKPYCSYYRRIKTIGTKRLELTAAESLKEEGFNVRPRVLSAQSDDGRVPDSYIDRRVAACDEFPDIRPQRPRPYTREAYDIWRNKCDEVEDAYYKRCAAARQKARFVSLRSGSKSHQRLLLCYLK